MSVSDPNQANFATNCSWAEGKEEKRGRQEGDETKESTEAKRSIADELEPSPTMCTSDMGLDLHRESEIVVVAGSQKTGKSTLMRSLIYTNVRTSRWNKIWLLCPTLSHAPDDYKWLPSKYKCESVTEEKLNEICDYMDRNKGARGALILDDCVGVLNLKSPLWTRLGASSRKLRLTIILIVQRLKAVPTIVRENVGDLFITRIMENSLEAAGELLPMFEKKREGVDFIKRNQGRKEADGRRHILRFNVGNPEAPPMMFVCPAAPNFYCQFE